MCALLDLELLHILNGDSVLQSMATSGISGECAVWAEVFHEGPVPGNLPPDQLFETRARFIAAQDWGVSYETVVGRQQRSCDRLAAFREFDEVILWFEHDLYDQLLLLHHLDFFAGQDLAGTRLSLICIAEFPGIERFIGLGQLDGAQLASLLESREPITPSQLELGRRAWSAFTSSDPCNLEQLVNGNTSDLRFVGAALRRFLEEYPSTRNGLGRTERQILGLLKDGPHSPLDLFRATYALEESPFLGDTTFWSRARALAEATRPAVETDVVERPGRLPEGTIRITDAGRDMLRNAADWIGLNGIDRWLGGVHLYGPEAAWRWEEEAGRTHPQG